MKNKWIAIIGIASAGVLSAHATLMMKWQGLSDVTSFGNTATVALSGIGSSLSKDTDTFSGTAVSDTGFGGTGSLSVNFYGGDAFTASAWTFTAQTMSVNDSAGLGVNTGGTPGKTKGLNDTEVIVFTIDWSSLNTGGNQLQFRVAALDHGLNLYEQTGAGAGAVLESAIAVGNSSGWYNVDRNGSLRTFAVMNNSASGSPSGFANLEFQVIPEPATLGMVAACGAGILFVRRRIMM